MTQIGVPQGRSYSFILRDVNKLSPAVRLHSVIYYKTCFILIILVMVSVGVSTLLERNGICASFYGFIIRLMVSLVGTSVVAPS